MNRLARLLRLAPPKEPMTASDFLAIRMRQVDQLARQLAIAKGALEYVRGEYGFLPAAHRRVVEDALDAIERIEAE